MAVLDGQPVNGAVTNAAFISRTVNSNTVAIVALDNTDVASGASVANIQQAHNETFDAVGMTGIGDATRKTYSSTQVIANGDDRKVAIGKLDAEFNSTTGHAHSGAAGDGAPISASNLTNFNKLFAVFQEFTVLGASGVDDVVTTQLTSKVPGGSSIATGVITVAPSNKCFIISNTTQDFIEDTSGRRVYGRITESAGVWTLSYYVNISGTETAHTLSTQDIKVIFWEVFDQSTRPTIPSNPFEFGTLDVTGDVIDATASLRGVLNPSLNPQTLGGAKVWNGKQTFLNQLVQDIDDDSTTTGTNATASMLAKAGSKLTNISLVSISTLTGADATYNSVYVLANATGNTVVLNHNTGAGGFLSPSGSNFDLKDKTAVLLIYDPVAQRWLIVSGGSGSLFSLSAVGSVPNANGASYNPTTGAFNLEPASASFPGVIVGADQELPTGSKKFNDWVATKIVNLSLIGSDQRITDQSASAVKLTNSGLISVDRIEVPTGSNHGWIFWIINDTTVTVTFKNLSGITASEQIITGSGGDLDVDPDASIFLLYDFNESKWRVIGGTGGGASKVQGTRGSPITISAGTGISSSEISTTSTNQVIFIQGATSGVLTDITASPQVVAHSKLGAKLLIIGRDNQKPVKFDNGTGLELNGSCELGASDTLELIWDGTAWVEVTRNV